MDAPLSARFCEMPWRSAEVHSGGDVYSCCPRWIRFRKIGNLFTDPPVAVWNSPAAQAIRQGVLDGSFASCDANWCPRIAGRELPLRRDIVDPQLRIIIDNGERTTQAGPAYVKFAHDVTCNLACPSCRSRRLIARGEERQRLDAVLESRFMPFLADSRIIGLAGDGDPFASRHYRRLMRLAMARNPDLKLRLHTNATLLDAKAWLTFALAGRCAAILVSIDAANSATYAAVRRFGDFARLQDNLQVLAARRRSGEFEEFSFSFTVQRRNYREMGPFVDWAAALGVDTVRFGLIHDWDRDQAKADFERAKIWDERHPEHGDFLNALRDPRLGGPAVRLGDVQPFYDRANSAA